MRWLISWMAALVLTGCATKQAKGIKTEVVTFPDGALVEFNGQPAGRAPASITLPQDEQGRLTQTAVVKAFPNTAQPHLFAQSRSFEPGERAERVPNQIMIDMRRSGTNEVAVLASEETDPSKEKKLPGKVPYTERSKPTQAVGLDRWNPGHH